MFSRIVDYRPAVLVLSDVNSWCDVLFETMTS